MMKPNLFNFEIILSLLEIQNCNSAFKLFSVRDLSNNSLNGPIPDFLMQLRLLKVL